MTYTVARKGSTLGSFTQQEVADGAGSGRFQPDDLVWCEGMPDWQRLSTVFGSRPAGVPPPLPPPGSIPEVVMMPRPGKPLGDDAAMRWLMPVGRSGWAIAAGYLGLFAFLVVPAPLALLVSIIAVWDIRRSRGAAHPKHGMGRAVFGLVIGLLGTLLLLAIVIAKATEHR